MAFLLFGLSSSAANGKTLSDLLDNLNKLESKFRSINDEQKLTNERINEIANRMGTIGLKINEIENNIIEAQNEISTLEDEINSKNKQIRDMINVYQKVNNKNLFLEVVFSSENLTDYILRKKVIENLSKYNEGLVDQYESKIIEMKEKEEELKVERKSLDAEKESLAKEQEQLGLKVTMLDEDSRDILEDIADARKTINNYQKMGCSLNDVLENCTSIPADSDFLRPLQQGVVTSGYGTRINPLTGYGYTFHAAVDIGGNPTGTSVYAAASGVVVYVSYVANPDIPNSSCGGNFVIIQHKINGIYYATRYMHLNKIYVTENQRVTSKDIIGAVGGGEIYDRCTTGPHLDFSIAQGIYGKDFYTFREPATINPYTMINLPAIGTYYSNRYQKYL